MKDIFAVLFSSLILSGCLQSAKEIGRNPSLSEVGDGLLDAEPGEDLMMAKVPLAKAHYSRWDGRRGGLFTDKLALDVGDILTVDIAIDDKAQLSNRSDSKRTVGRGLNLIGNFAVDGVGRGGTADGNVDSSSDFKGSGGTARSESIRLSVAAVVTRVLGNGNLIVRGSQEVRVNAELRVLSIAGIVRPSDIGPNNTIPYERIAEARVSYGGRGHISHMQRPPYGQQILNHVLPF